MKANRWAIAVAGTISMAWLGNVYSGSPFAQPHVTRRPGGAA